jgi:NADH dehydrogenase
VKPATIFGPEDRFLNWMAEGMTRSPYFPLLNGGSTQVQPIYAHDVGKALMALVEVGANEIIDIAVHELRE